MKDNTLHIIRQLQEKYSAALDVGDYPAAHKADEQLKDEWAKLEVEYTVTRGQTMYDRINPNVTYIGDHYEIMRQNAMAKEEGN